MSRINRVPFGLQDLLGSQNFGDNPSELAQVVAPSLDMLPFLSAERMSYEYASASVSGNAEIASMVVPEGELWYLVGCGCAMKANSGEPTVAYGVRISAGVFNVPTSSSPAALHGLCGFTFDEEVPTALTTVQYDYKGEQFPEPVPVFGGSTVRWFTAGSYGITAWAVKVHLRYIKVTQ